MGTYVPVYGYKHRLTADCVRHAVAQQDPSVRWGDLGVWYGRYVVDEEEPLWFQGVGHMQTVFVRELEDRDLADGPHPRW